MASHTRLKRGSPTQGRVREPGIESISISKSRIRIWIIFNREIQTDRVPQTERRRAKARSETRIERNGKKGRGISSTELGWDGK